MNKLKIFFIVLFGLVIAACGSESPSEPFLGKWSIDKEMTLQKNAGATPRFLSELRREVGEVQFDISEKTVIYKISGPGKSVKMVFNYEFTDTKVNVAMVGEKEESALNFTYNPDPAKLTLLPKPEYDLSQGVIFMKENNYMVVHTPSPPGGDYVSLYFIKEED